MIRLIRLVLTAGSTHLVRLIPFNAIQVNCWPDGVGSETELTYLYEKKLEITSIEALFFTRIEMVSYFIAIAKGAFRLKPERVNLGTVCPYKLFQMAIPIKQINYFDAQNAILFSLKKSTIRSRY